MAYLIIILAFGLVAFNIWLAERREDRWHRRMSDLLNRKMAKDFYDYVQGSADLERASKMTAEQLRFAEILAALVPAATVRMRRDFRQLLTAIQAVALLSQCQREQTPEGAVIATIGDYAVARHLLIPIFDSIITDGVTPAVRETVEAVRPDEEVSETELGQRLKLSRSTISYRVGRALRAGWLVNRESRRGHPARLAQGAPLPEIVGALPEPERVREVFECSNGLGVEGYSSPPPPTASASEADQTSQAGTETTADGEWAEV